MGEENIFSYYRNTFKTNRIDWDLAKARQVLHTWQRAFVQVRVFATLVHPAVATCMELHAVHAGHLCGFLFPDVLVACLAILLNTTTTYKHTPCSGQELKSNLKAMSILKRDRNLHRCVLLQMWQRHVEHVFRPAASHTNQIQCY